MQYLFLIAILTQLHGVHGSEAELVQVNTSHVYLFLREEETPVGKAILSASRVFYVASAYAKRGIPSVVIEELQDFIGPAAHHPESVYSAQGENAFLRVDRNTGLVETLRKLDIDDPLIVKEGCKRADTDPVERGLPTHLLHKGTVSEHCCFWLRIDNSQTGAITVDICIEDINDNAPTWKLDNTEAVTDEDTDLTLQIPENIPVGTAIDVPRASDADLGLNKVIRYDMWPIIPDFELLWNESSEKLSIIVKETLDREKQSLYSVSIIATDGGIQPKTGTLDVRVVIQDVNDNNPVFDSPVYSVNIPEAAFPSFPVMQVHATDHDDGQNAELTYSISSLTDPEVIQMFSIDKKTGWISLDWKLDFENQKQLSLTVEAADRGVPQRQSVCKVEITVLDDNDNAPQLLFEPASLTNFALVPENEIPGRIVAVFTVVDDDSGENGEVVCEKTSVVREIIVDGSADNRVDKDNTDQDLKSFFKLDLMDLPFAKVYQLSTVVTFDREQGERYRVGITCVDRGSPAQTTTGLVLVRILDVNDHTPAFSSNHFNFRASESQSVNTTLFSLPATDPDNGENGTISYQLLTGHEDSLFVVHRTSGDVMLQQPLDYEQLSQYNFTLLAIDGGSPPLTGSTAVTIFVEDANDNAPTVTSALLFSVVENHPATDVVGTVTAVDFDSGLNGNVFFKISSVKPCFCGVNATGNKKTINDSFCTWVNEMANRCDVQLVDQAFRLCSKTPLKYALEWTSKEYRRFLMTEKGDIYLRYPNLDRESVPVYLIQGAALDRGNPPQKTMFCATVVVNDFNDSQPKFIFPALTKNTIIAKLPMLRGEPLIQLHAMDYDVYENGDLRFAFSEDSEAAITGLFAIHAYSGLIVSQYSLRPRDLDFLGPSALNQTHTLKVKVYDMGMPPLVSYATLRLRFQVRINHDNFEFPSILEQMQQQNVGHSISSLFDEHGGARTEELSREGGNRRTNLVFVIFCALFLIVLLFLTVVVLVIFGRRSRPSLTVPPAAAPTNIRSIVQIPPAPHHPFLQSHCHQRSALPAPVLPYHTLAVATPISTPTCTFVEACNLSVDSSTV